MPGKSKRKQMRYASSKQNKTGQTQPAATAPAAGVGPSAAVKAQTPSVKSSPAAAKTAPAQYTPELLKHVGTELKITLALSASILVVIIILSLVLH
jgi:hypothetical protein